MNYAGFTKKCFEIVIVTLHPSGCCSTIKTYAPHSFECLPLCCLTSLSSHCSVFKVQYFQPLLKPDLKIQIPLGFEIQQQTAVFCLVGLSGLEPPTLRLSVVRSSQLSYKPVFGGDSRDRTGDLLLARQALSQLSYIPTSLLIPPKAYAL